MIFIDKEKNRHIAEVEEKGFYVITELRSDNREIENIYNSLERYSIFVEEEAKNGALVMYEVEGVVKDMFIYELEQRGYIFVKTEP